MAEKFWYLKSCRILEHLADDELRALESTARARKVTRGEPIYLPADNADGVLLLVSGRVKICHLTPDGKQSILAFIDAGELFGELSLFQAGGRNEYAEAVEKSHVVLIPRDVFQRLMTRHADLSLKITKLVGMRRQRIERRLRNLLFRSNRERLVHLLLELAEQYGRKRQHGIELKIRLSHQDLANVIGSTRETVTVLLGELQDESLVRIARRRITLEDLEGLAATVSEEAPYVKRDSGDDIPVPAVFI